MADKYKLQELPCSCQLGGSTCDNCIQFWNDLGRSFGKIDNIREEC